MVLKLNLGWHCLPFNQEKKIEKRTLVLTHLPFFFPILVHHHRNLKYHSSLDQGAKLCLYCKVVHFYHEILIGNMNGQSLIFPNESGYLSLEFILILMSICILFYLEQKGHGIHDSLVKEVRDITHKFFGLPYEDKLKIKMTPATGYRYS